MSPGMQHELMNDHWGSWNWQKIINLGALMTCQVTKTAAN